MLLSLLIGCWMDFATLPQLNVDDVQFSNAFLEVDNVRIQIFTSNLLCPDGKGASFFVMYPESDEPLPVAVVFPSGPMVYSDYVETGKLSPQFLNTWGSSRVWETLNLSRKTLDTAVTDLGYLPTALANANIAQVYPTNCWGDLWHNGLEINPNSADVDGFSRLGLDMAQFTLDFINDPSIADTMGWQLNQQLNPTEQYWIGLGTGGQAIIELLRNGNNTPTGILFDSTPGILSPYFEYDLPYEQSALEQIFGDSDLDSFSLMMVDLPERTGWIWSNGDPQIPYESIEYGTDMVDGWVLDTNEIGHVFSNADWELANQSVEFLQTGTITAADSASE